MLISLIGIILRSYHEEVPSDEESHSKILPAVKYIEENFQNKITLDTLAEKCFLSGRQLSRLFEKAYDKSPIEYLLNYRLITAYLYLMITKDSIAVIAKKMWLL